MTSDYTTVDRIIAKIDNDFNPSNSDWIPRVGAWVYDALMQLDCVQTERKRKVLTVKNNIARSDCELSKNIKVYDQNGCKVVELNTGGQQCCGGNVSRNGSSTGERELTPDTITTETRNTKELSESIASQINGPWPPRYNVINGYKSELCQKGYARINNKTLELNFDTNSITVEYDSVITEKCNVFNCNAPVIPNNGLLIEAITYYCMYKMLTRGYVHPVMNLAANQYGTNPYYIWKTTKDEAKRDVINGNVNDNLDDLWRSAFYINTFNPRGKS